MQKNNTFNSFCSNCRFVVEPSINGNLTYTFTNEFKGKLAIIWQPKFDPKFINIVELFGYRIFANFEFPFKFGIIAVLNKK